MKTIWQEKSFKEWIESPAGQEAMMNPDPKEGMFLAFQAGSVMAEQEMVRIIKEEHPQGRLV